jgi:small subunit ribosomal protein S1
MDNSDTPDSKTTPQTGTEPSESFGDLLSQFDRSHAQGPEEGNKQINGTVVAITDDSVILDIGFKSEGTLPLAAFQGANEAVKPGDTIQVSVKGRGLDGYYELSRLKIAPTTDWSSLERAFAEKSIIVGTVTGVIKGGVSVDVGVRAFMPASRAGVRETAQLEKLVGEQINCRILKLDVAEEDVVVDRRAVLEEEERLGQEQRFSQVKEGDVVHGEVRSLTDYGAFVDIGGVDGLLHISDISWTRIANSTDVLSIGQKIQAKVLKIDAEKRRISLGLKQLQPQPWDSVSERYKNGDRIHGIVTRTTDFGAFVELEPGVEGLIHVSEMSWTKKVRKPSDILKPGDTVEAMILTIQGVERRISLGLRQALGDPWADAATKFAPGTQIQGPVTSVTKFGAFVQLGDGVEGMVHISEISADKHIHHPQDVLKLGQVVKALVIAVDTEKRQLRLSMKQLIPTSLDEYLAEHNVGDLVSGRVVDDSGSTALVELGEGVRASCPLAQGPRPGETTEAGSKPDLGSLTSMLQARWKGKTSGSAAKATEPVRSGQIRSFRISELDRQTKSIKLEIVS